MTSRGDIEARRVGELQPFRSQEALADLPRRQGLWVAGSSAAAALLAATPLWAFQPELGLTLSIAAGAAMVNPRRLWAAPMVAAAVAFVGLVFFVFQWPVVIGASAVAGALATWMLPQRTDWIDALNGALGAVAASSIALWAATTLLPGALPVMLSAVGTAALVALAGSQGLLPAALRFDGSPQLPTPRQIQRELRNRYRPPVLRALAQYRSAQGHVIDRDTRRGLAEVVTWVFRLQTTLQALDHELEQIDPDQVGARIARNRASSDSADPFTRERRHATADHLERLLEHRALIEVERSRSEALSDYALAFIEEARAGLTIAQRLPSEAVPERLQEVLFRLRSQAIEGDARRRTARELART